MESDRTQPPDSRPARERLIDEVCDDFEQQWQSGKRPDVAAYLPRVDEPLRAELLCELVALDVEYRRRAGESVQLDDYRRQFPDRATQLDAVQTNAVGARSVSEGIVVLFERAWQRGRQPRIEAYVAHQVDAQPHVLRELVNIELQYRLRAGEAARVEEYLARFPVLAQDDEFVLSLISHERRLRSEHEEAPGDEQYVARFPQYRAQLTPETEPRRSADHDLLFGLLALQNDFVSRDELVTATGTWLSDKKRPLCEILVKNGALERDELRILLALLNKHLEKHGNNVAQSLAALSSIGSLRAELQSLGDPDVGHSLAQLPASKERDARSTVPALTDDMPTTADQQFQVLRRHDRSRWGQVLVALDEGFGREVALVELLPSEIDFAVNRAHFLQEAKITGTLEHPGIVPVYRIGQHADGRPYYVMRLVQGSSLKDSINHFHEHAAHRSNAGERILELQRLLNRFISVCHTVAYAHNCGFLHGSLEPDNVRLGCYGETLVVDWGLARPLSPNKAEQAVDERTVKVERGDGGSKRGQVTSGAGTPAYMSPEQAAGKWDELGPATDIYSLGAMLFCLLTGQSPLSGELNREHVLSKVQAGEFPRPRAVRRDVPRALEAICLKAMALQGIDRYGSALELVKDIECWLAGEPVSAHRDSLLVRAIRYGRKHPKTVVALTVVTLTGLAAAIVMVRM